MENKTRESLSEMKKELMGKIGSLDYREARLVLSFTGGLKGEEKVMGKVVEFAKSQDKEVLDGEKMFKQAEYYVVGGLCGKEVRVPFDGTVFTNCQECGKQIEFDIHELVSFQREGEGFTEFGAFTCHDCLQKRGQAVEPVCQGTSKLAILEVAKIIGGELRSVSDSNKEALSYFLSEAFNTEDEEGLHIRMEKVAGYAEALRDNGLMDDAEHDMLSVDIEAVQNKGE